MFFFYHIVQPSEICVSKSAAQTGLHTTTTAKKSLDTKKILPNTHMNANTHSSHSPRQASKPPVSLLLFQVLRGKGNPWNDSWHDGSQSSAGWAVWYQHFSAWLWTSKEGGFAMISPGCSSSCICSAGWSYWRQPTVPVNPQKCCRMENW